MPSPTDQDTFERGVAAFEARAFFEAHEHWEALWTEAAGDERRWLQGLIQVAAAFVHFERGHYATGFVKLLSDGWAKMDGYAGETFGLDTQAFRASLAPWREHARRVAEGADLQRDAPSELPTMAAPTPRSPPEPGRPGRTSPPG